MTAAADETAKIPGPVTIPLDTLSGWIGKDLGASRWLEVDQDLVDRYAELTGDHSWIHVDRERAQQEIGGTIAHGLLILSLLPMMLKDIYRISGVERSLNYGYDRLRYTGTVPVGSHVRLRMGLEAVKPQGDGRRVTFSMVVERQGADRPVVVGDWIVLIYPKAERAA